MAAPDVMARDAGKPPKDKQGREEKLAAALRANLRRRKAPPTSPAGRKQT